MSLRHRLDVPSFPDWNPRGKCIHTGFCSLACTKALLKSMEFVSQLRVRDKIRKSLTELQATTGTNVSGSPSSSRSPRTQYCALVEFAYLSIRHPFSAKDPGARQDSSFCIHRFHIYPCSIFLKTRNLVSCSLAPF